MNATVSPVVRLMSPAALRFGVWHAPQARRTGAVSVTSSSQTSPSPQDQSGGWQAEWHLQRQMPVPLAVLSRWWWMASVLGLVAALTPLSGVHGVLLTPVAPVASGSAPGHALHLVAVWAVLSLATRIALWAHGRHALDHDHIAMRADRVHVDCCRAGQTQSLDCHPRWLRVEPVQHDRSLIRVSGEGCSVVVGEFVPGDGRRQLANELRWALRHLDD